MKHPLTFLVALLLAPLAAHAADELPKRFINPPAMVKPWLYRCGMNGNTELVVCVTHLWPNRPIGDERFAGDLAKGFGGGLPAWPEGLGSDQPRHETNRLTFFTRKHWNRDDALLPSGLPGPGTVAALRGTEMKGDFALIGKSGA